MLRAYTDGTFNNKNGITGYGVVIVKDNKVIDSFGGTVPNSTMWQIEGELTAVKKAVEYCVWRDIKEIEINYDYNGCEFFATGKWKTKKDFIIKYKQFIKESDIKIVWRKVKAHSGDIYNDLADKIAREQKWKTCSAVNFQKQQSKEDIIKNGNDNLNTKKAVKNLNVVSCASSQCAIPTRKIITNANSLAKAVARQPI